MELQKVNNNLQVATLAPAASSQKLLQCLIRLETNERTDAKMDLLLITNELMPRGVPDMLGVAKYPTIASLVKTEGRRKMLAVLILLVKDFCASLNVVRNMNEDQMLETAAMLLEECGNFRIEDYVIMFSLAKKGQLVKLYDRIDIQFITAVLDAYWIRRNEAGRKAQEEEATNAEIAAAMNDQERKKLVWDDSKGYVAAPEVANIGGALESLKQKLIDCGHVPETKAKATAKEVVDPLIPTFTKQGELLMVPKSKIHE